MKFKKILIYVALIGNFIFTTLAEAQTTTLKLAHGATADQAIGQAMQKFAQLVDQKSGGNVKVEVFLSGSLYSERTSLEALGRFSEVLISQELFCNI
ncbi:hypothetical protein [Polynucleobacter sinensis]|uniref:hypothetical protein n=1 Tax=Polynucleobacter sinensis TaxID=1743157 RepID=UPI0007834F0D|nr:hypothetical protein [Polynucleobacter sinensis]